MAAQTAFLFRCLLGVVGALVLSVFFNVVLAGLLIAERWNLFDPPVAVPVIATAPAEQVPGTSTLDPRPVPVEKPASTAPVSTLPVVMLPPRPRTVAEVAAYLEVDEQTVLDVYIPAWVRAGYLDPDTDCNGGRWKIPATFLPHRLGDEE